MATRRLVTAVAVMALAGAAGATTTVNGVSTSAIAGGTAWDLHLTCDVDWTNSRITVELTTGNLVDPDGLRFHFAGVNDADTWVDAASPDDADTQTMLHSLEGTEVLDWSWFDAVSSGPMTWHAARIVLTNDAVGTISMENFDADSGGTPYTWSMPLPEPASLVMLGGGALFLLRRGRNIRR